MQIDAKHIAKITKTPSWKSHNNLSKTFLRTDHWEIQNWLIIFKKMHRKKKKEKRRRKMWCFVFQLKYVMVCHFWRRKSFFLHILHQYSVPSNINPLYFFWLKHCILWSKQSIKVQILRFLSAQVKICQILHVNFELTVNSYSIFASFFIVMTHNYPVIFKLIYFQL